MPEWNCSVCQRGSQEGRAAQGMGSQKAEPKELQIVYIEILMSNNKYGLLKLNINLLSVINLTIKLSY